MRVQGMHTSVDSSSSRSNNAAAAALRSMLLESPGSQISPDDVDNASTGGPRDFTPSPSPSPGSSPYNHGIKRPHAEEDSDEEPNDEVRLWEDGFKDRYYESKFDVAPD